MNETMYMDATKLELFFSINAGEANPDNDWTKEYLADWVSYCNGAKISYREVITLEKRCQRFYDLPVWTLDEQEIPVMNLVSRCCELFAFYQGRLPRNITYLERFNNAREEIKHIVRIHERMHAFHHCHHDEVNGQENLWVDFINVSPVYKEFLAQLFTFKCVENTYLEKYFEGLSKVQPHIYQTWELKKTLSKEEVVDIFLKIKNKEEQIPFLDTYAKLYDAPLIKEKTEQSQPAIEITENLCRYEKALIDCIAEMKQNPLSWDCVDNKRIDHSIIDAIHDLW